MAGGHVKYRALSRSSSHRQALLRNLVTSLFKSEAIQTTWHKAKEAQRLADKLVTLGKRNSVASRKRAHQIFYNPGPLVEKLFGPIRERYLNRPGGYTRVLHIESPKEDQAKSAILELVDGPADMRFRMTAKTVARQRGMAVARESAEKANANVRNKAQTISNYNTETDSNTTITTNIPFNPSDLPENRYNYTGITPLTALNIKKVTQFRKDGLSQFDQLVQKFEEHQHYEHVSTGNANNHYNYHKVVTYNPDDNHLYNYNNNNNNKKTTHQHNQQAGHGVNSVNSINANDNERSAGSVSNLANRKPGTSTLPSNLIVLTKLNDRTVERHVERQAVTKKRVYPVQIRGQPGKKGMSRKDREERKRESEARRRREDQEVELDELDEKEMGGEGGQGGGYGYGSDDRSSSGGQRAYA